MLFHNIILLLKLSRWTPDLKRTPLESLCFQCFLCWLVARKVEIKLKLNPVPLKISNILPLSFYKKLVLLQCNTQMAPFMISLQTFHLCSFFLSLPSLQYVVINFTENEGRPFIKFFFLRTSSCDKNSTKNLFE